MKEKTTMQSSFTKKISFIRLAPWADVRNAHPRDLIWPLGILNCNAIARQAGWESQVVDQHVENIDGDQIADRIVEFGPAVVLIDVPTLSVRPANEIAKRLKQELGQVKIYGIGHHPTERPADFLYEDAAFDGCLLGECEVQMANLLNNPALPPPDNYAIFDNIEKKVVLHGGPAELTEIDQLPPIDPGCLDTSKYRINSLHLPIYGKQRWGFLHTSRGCPFGCIFCSRSLRVSYGNKYRAHSPQRVAEDMLRLKHEHQVNAIYMIDDLFTHDRRRIVELCEILRREDAGILWAIQTRAEQLDRELLFCLKAAGCCAVKVGIESGVDRILHSLKKGCTRQQLKNAVMDIHAADMYLTACFMIGNPHETSDDIKKTFRFALELKADMIQVALHTPYPGSHSFEKYCKDIGSMEGLSHYDGLSVVISELDRRSLEAEQKRFYLKYYLNPGVLLRYIKRRAVYSIFCVDEWKLLFNSLRYLLKPNKRADR
jgi:radical SAM superfamily enzyme YgiQ (UPF0313 family)